MTTTILVIEDNPKDQRLVQIALDEAIDLEHEVLMAGSLAAGREVMSSQHVDIVLLDLNLGDSSGLETLQQVSEGHPEVPVIVLTGLADDDLGMAAIRAGAQDFLVKGKMFGELLSRSIRYAQERHRILAELRAAQA